MMFARKRPQLPRLVIYDALGKVLFSDRLDHLILTEDRVNAMSEEFFGDPAPCEIHRAAVMQRAFAEIETILAPGCEIDISEMDQRMAGYFEGYGEADTICMPAEQEG